MEKNEKELVIPENCLPVEYLIMGLTMSDRLAIGICVVIGSVVALSVYHRTHNSMIAVAVIFAVAIVAITLWRRDRFTENIFNKIWIAILYQKTQKNYLYEYVDTWDKEITYDVRYNTRK